MLRHEAEGILGRVAPILCDEDPLYYIYNWLTKNMSIHLTDMWQYTYINWSPLFTKLNFLDLRECLVGGDEMDDSCLNNIVSFFFFFIYVGCPGQLTRTTIIPHGPLDTLQAQEHVRHRGGDRRAHRGSNPGRGRNKSHDWPRQLDPQLLNNIVSCLS